MLNIFCVYPERTFGMHAWAWKSCALAHLDVDDDGDRDAGAPVDGEVEPIEETLFFEPVLYAGQRQAASQTPLLAA